MLPLVFVLALLCIGQASKPDVDSRSVAAKEIGEKIALLEVDADIKQYSREFLETQDYIIPNKTEAMIWVNTTGNLNATLKPIAVCPNKCFGHGVCIPVPSPSPSSSAKPPGQVKADDPALEALRNLAASDPGAYARELALKAVEEAIEVQKQSFSSSPSPATALEPGASPSASPIPGQIGGAMTEDMIPFAPPGTPGGPAVMGQRRFVPGMCVCNFAYFGPFCEYEYCYPMLQCMGRGRCTNTSTPYNPLDDPPMYCRCEDGWTGSNCEIADNRCGVLTGPYAGVGADCSGEGRCEEGVCICNEGRAGLFCERKVCPNGCSGHGKCDDETGTCVCDPPFFGKLCSLMYCPNNCSGHGMCDRYNGECDCEPNWYGDECEHKMCPHDCSGYGDCDQNTGICTCDERRAGAACDKFECPDDCGGGHRCINGVCICDPGWIGLTCNTSVCWHKCNGHVNAECHPLTGACTCRPGWIGPSCEIDDRCPKWKDEWDGKSYDCSRHGHCKDGKCVCDHGWTGFDCSAQHFECSDDYACENDGVCVNHRCQCTKLWTGFDCSLPILSLCNTNADCQFGECIEGGVCSCLPGRGGDFCQKITNRKPFEPDQIPRSSKSSSISISPSQSPSPKVKTRKKVYANPTQTSAVVTPSPTANVTESGGEGEGGDAGGEQDQDQQARHRHRHRHVMAAAGSVLLVEENKAQQQHLFEQELQQQQQQQQQPKLRHHRHHDEEDQGAGIASFISSRVSAMASHSTRNSVFGVVLFMCSFVLFSVCC